jgi:hypothetical protein
MSRVQVYKFIHAFFGRHGEDSLCPVDTGVEFSYILGNRHAAGARIYCTLGIGAEVPLVQAGKLSNQGYMPFCNL